MAVMYVLGVSMLIISSKVAEFTYKRSAVDNTVPYGSVTRIDPVSCSIMRPAYCPLPPPPVWMRHATVATSVQLSVVPPIPSGAFVLRLMTAESVRDVAAVALACVNQLGVVIR